MNNICSTNINQSFNSNLLLASIVVAFHMQSALEMLIQFCNILRAQMCNPFTYNWNWRTFTFIMYYMVWTSLHLYRLYPLTVNRKLYLCAYVYPYMVFCLLRNFTRLSILELFTIRLWKRKLYKIVRTLNKFLIIRFPLG